MHIRPREILKQQVLKMYFEEHKSVEIIIKELKQPSIRLAYYWIKEHKSMYLSSLSLSKSELSQIADIKPSKGFKTIEEELKTLRLGMILPALIDELKKKGKIT